MCVPRGFGSGAYFNVDNIKTIDYTISVSPS
nr:MAG TPA: hypothetical protein [Caudoviricetes sp.]